jgi:hypothetical protein
MKTVKAICPAVVLALVLSVSALAGDVQTPGAPMPPPPPATQPSETSDNGCVATAVCSTSDDICASGYADILWALTSIF